MRILFFLCLATHHTCWWLWSRSRWIGWCSMWTRCCTRWCAFHLDVWLPCLWMHWKWDSCILIQRSKFLALAFYTCMRVHWSLLGSHIAKPTYQKQQKELMSLSYLKTLWPKNSILQNNLCKWSARNLFNGSFPFIKWWNNQTHVHLQGNGKFSIGIWCTNCPTCTLSHDRALGSIKNSHEPFSSSLPASNN
jgi:hypothetical protein